jgi:hypothetical protein
MSHHGVMPARRSAIPGQLAGLVGGNNSVQTPQTDVSISLPTAANSSGFLLPFLGEVQKLEGTQANGRTTFHLPPVLKGAVFW